MPLEVLHGAFMLFGRRARLEGTKIPLLAGLRIYLAGIEPVLAGLQFPDHNVSPSFSELFRSMAGQPSCSGPGRCILAIRREHDVSCRLRNDIGVQLAGDLSLCAGAR